MDRDEARNFLREITGGCWPSWAGAETLISRLSSSPSWTGRSKSPLPGTGVKTKHLKQDPRASLCVLTEEFHPYLTVEGKIDLLSDPDGRKNFDLYQAITGGPPENLAEYFEAMKREKRLVYEMTIEGMYPLEN